MIFLSFDGDSPWSNYAFFINSDAYRRALVGTLFLSAIVAVVVVLVSTILAWFLRFSQSRLLKGLILISILAPFMMGVVVKNYSLALFLQQDGVVSRIWELVPVIGAPIDLMYTPTAVVIGIAYSVLPYGVLPLTLVFAHVEQSQIDAAKMLGAAKHQAFMNAVVPQILPGVLASGALVFMMSIGYYVTPVMLGGAGSPFLASLIHRQVFQQFDISAASASGAILVLSAALVLIAVILGIGVRRLRRYI
ncbi:ABC transporter permease [Brevibacterium luteolum]|uniref:ABC transporter permease n=1 Tax=Brevibacterium luteolum TaxID=199591 RepID=UPI003B678B92